MRRILLFIPVLLVLLYSCNDDPDPHADFRVSATLVEVNENIRFTNTSLNAMDVEWDFGDGFVSNVYNPVHFYDKPGVYEVRLTVWSRGNKVSTAYQTIEVIYPTATLDIEVLEYYMEYPVADASVILYGSYMDWMDELNPIIEGFTDVDGIVVFTGLPAKEYFVDVWEANHDNYSLAEDDVGFISTGVLYPGEINYFTAWVDYYPPTKSGAATKLERRERNVELESKDRKFSDKPKRERKK
jgi:hypothetical protein